jgi:hypothetical protein
MIDVQHSQTFAVDNPRKLGLLITTRFNMCLR